MREKHSNRSRNSDCPDQNQHNQRRVTGDRVEQSPGLAGLRLYVDKTNRVAQQVYDALGMTAEHYDLYEWLE